MHPPRFDLAPRIVDRQELVPVQKCIAQLAVEGLDAAVFYLLSRPERVNRRVTSDELLADIGHTWGYHLSKCRILLQ
jgi:hypothetical protein